MPRAAASGLPSSAIPIGAVIRWDSGSATPQKMRPMPIPVANIIEIQDRVLNSGRSSSRPKRIRPYRETARSSITTTKPAVAKT